MRAATITPVGSSGGYLARFPADCGLPRYSGGSAPTLAVSRPARCSLALRPARSADPLKEPFLEVLQTIRRLLIRPECFRLEREFAGLDLNRGEWCTLTRHTEQYLRTRAPTRRHPAKGHKRLPRHVGREWRGRRANRRRHRPHAFRCSPVPDHSQYRRHLAPQSAKGGDLMVQDFLS